MKKNYFYNAFLYVLGFMTLSQTGKSQCLSGNSSPVTPLFAATTTVGGNVYSATGPDLNSVQGNFFEVSLSAGYQYKFWLSYWNGAYEISATNLNSTVTDSANNVLVPTAQGAYVYYTTKTTRKVRIHVFGNSSCGNVTYSTPYGFYLYVYTDAKCATTYRDADMDGYGNPLDSLQYDACPSPTAGYVTNKTDCDDNNPAAHATQTWYKDIDNDGYGDMSDPGVINCGMPATNTVVPHYVTNHSDCDDASAAKHIVQIWYVDADGDGSGSVSDPGISNCGNPNLRLSSGVNYSLDNKDCDDNNPFIGPGAVEIYGNSIDENCDGLITPPVNSALNFNGTYSHVQVNHSSTLNLDTNFTIEALVYTTGVGYLTIIDKGSYDYLLQIQGQKLAFYDKTPPATWYLSTNVVPLNQWVHVAMTKDENDTIRFYINGVANGVYGGVKASQDLGAMNIGRQEPANCQCNLFAGNMDELRIWNVTRTPQQINRFMNSALCYNEKGLAAYYKFDDGLAGADNSALTILKDHSGNHNDGTYMNFNLGGGNSANFVAGDSIPFTMANTQISGPTSVCQNSPLTLSGTNGSVYVWNNGVVNDSAFIPTGAQTYLMMGIDSVGCSNFDSITVTLNSLPIVGSSATSASVCVGNPDTLNAMGANTYTWSSNAGSATTMSVSVTQTVSATYVYTVTGADANGCVNTSTVSVVVNSCGLQVNQLSKAAALLTLYPNPNTGSFAIEADKELGKIEIYNVMGQMVHTTNVSETKTEINVGNCSPGVYYVKANGVIMKMIKE